MNDGSSCRKHPDQEPVLIYDTLLQCSSCRASWETQEPEELQPNATAHRLGAQRRCWTRFRRSVPIGPTNVHVPCLFSDANRMWRNFCFPSGLCCRRREADAAAARGERDGAADGQESSVHLQSVPVDQCAAKYTHDKGSKVVKERFSSANLPKFLPVRFRFLLFGRERANITVYDEKCSG